MNSPLLGPARSFSVPDGIACMESVDDVQDNDWTVYKWKQRLDLSPVELGSEPEFWTWVYRNWGSLRAQKTPLPVLFCWVY